MMPVVVAPIVKEWVNPNGTCITTQLNNSQKVNDPAEEMGLTASNESC